MVARPASLQRGGCVKLNAGHQKEVRGTRERDWRKKGDKEDSSPISLPDLNSPHASERVSYMRLYSQPQRLQLASALNALQCI
jgi:hypothetical protein